MAISFETGLGHPLPALVLQRSRTAAPENGAGRTTELAAGFIRLPGAAEVYHRTNGEWTIGREGGINYVTLSGFGGLAAAVPAGRGEQGTAAMNLLQFLTSHEQFGTTFPPYARSVCRASQASYPDLWLADDLTAAEGGSYLGELSRTLDNKAFVTELPMTGRRQFREALTAGLTSALEGESEPETALNNIADQWRAIAEAIGVITVRDSYRSSLGLRPLGPGK